MKIRKVKISAFRAFDNLEDSTFDFSLGKDNTANFISIYAPNGYGKTSFYDAVEWAVTGQISRFQKNAPENRKVGIENRKNNRNQYLLQHNGQNKLGFVEVFTDNEKVLFPKKKISETTVYDFNKAPTNSYFRDVVLSQDLIDTFIKEEKAEDRYRKFISNIPHLNDYNTGLQNLIKLIENVDGEVSELKSNIKKLEDRQLQIDFEGDSKVLEEINNTIGFLIKKEEELSLIEKSSFSKTAYASLTQKIDSMLVKLQIEIEAMKLRVGNIEIAFNGTNEDENKSGVVQYYNNVGKLKELAERIIKLKAFIKIIEQKEVAEKLKLKLNKELDENINLSVETFKIKKQFPRYETVQKNIDVLNKKIDENNTIIENQKKSKQKSKSNLSDLKIDLSKLKVHIEAQKEKLEKIPDFEKKINLTNKEEENLRKELSHTETTIELNKELLKETIGKLGENNSYLDIFNSDIDLLLDIELFSDYEIKIRKILKSNNEIGKLERNLSALNSKINEQKSLNNELKIFISKGLELISENKETFCPLCMTNYDTYIELSDRISSNPLIDNLLKLSLTEKVNLESQIKKARRANSVILNEIKDFIEKIIFKEEKNKIKTVKELSKLNLLLEKNRESLKVLKGEKEISSRFLEELSINDLKKKVSTDIEASEAKIKTLSTKIDSANSEIEKITDVIDKALKESQLFKSSIEEEKKTEVFKLIEKYFNERIKTNTIDITVLNSFIIKIEINSNDSKKKINDQELKINKSNELLANNDLTKDELNKQIELTSKVHSLNKKILENFENYIHSDFKIDLSILSQKEATSQFGGLKTNILKKITNQNEILKYYKIAENLKDKVYDFLETEKTKDSIEEIKKEIQVNINIVANLTNEKESLEKYLKETIDNFFYTELINKIYSKIDPHPDNYRIEFDCDFNEAKPRLQIYTSDSENIKSVPALYFSTAQINILSLSIFLARALKASNPKTKEPIKCIFIDDPIQSMDSINILSFIDLFRSLSVNLDRQLIVSTHEENFHLLLQKKIPEKLFKSKFIQFETFGKLEKMANG